MKRTRLSPISKQKIADNVKYAKAKEEWREARIEKDGYHRCEFVYKDGPRCTANAMPPPHHKKGRHGPLLYNKRYFMAACFDHHSYIHNNSREARKRGYVLWK